MPETTTGRGSPETSAPKLHEVMRLLADESKGEKRGTPSSIPFTIQEIGESLYARAPRDFITQTEIPRLTHIVQEAYEFLGDYLESGKEYDIRVIPLVDRGPGRNKATGILSAFSDRSFIVDTVSCCLESMNLRKHLFLHPLLRFPDRSIVSLAYIETDHVADPAAATELEQLLRSAYHDLFIATEEFSPMQRELEKLVESFAGKKSKENGEEIPSGEIAEFLTWLSQGAFIFLGLRRTQLPDGKKNGTDHFEHHSELGIFKPTVECPAFAGIDKMLDAELAAMAAGETGLLVSKLPARSIIHRRAFLDAISLRFPDRPQAISIVGMFSSRANKLESAAVPLLRQILQQILCTENLIPGSHAYKELISVVDNMPRAELLSEPRETLRSDIRLITEAASRPEVRLRLSADRFRRFGSALVILPKQRMGASAQELIVNELESAFGCVPGSSETTVGSSELPLALLHVLLPTPQNIPSDHSVIEATIAGETITWEEEFRNQIIEGNDLSLLPERARLAGFYNKAFPDDYKALVSPREATLDVQCLERLSKDNPLEVDVRESLNGHPVLSIFRVGRDHTVSSVFPYLENTGLTIIREHVVQLTSRFGLSIGIYRLELERVPEVPVAKLRENLLGGFAEVLRGSAENDTMNRLLIQPGLKVDQVAVLRLYTRYMKQIRAGTSADVICGGLTQYPRLARIFSDAFAVKFDPDLFPASSTERESELTSMKEAYFLELKKVTQLTYDRAFRLLWLIFEASVRTNFYNTADKSRISVKIKPKGIPNIPLPIPYAEIIVSAIDFEGVHLRGGRVARGGIRWSDRIDDYRTEVLGLMKTQMLKNSIIIPTGAKGGFVLKHRPQDPKELTEAVKACYRRYIRSLLEVTDNRRGQDVVHPNRCIVYDGEDPYFVVAADRGTAMLSDTANEIAVREFNLWIGDAFASGGSNGYDHKKLAITSRGTWETTCRHFREMGLDPESTDFTVTGIGDMSGDVFGNGLLRSRRAKLVAAFNHKHIFIDPNPNPEASFDERSRLFALPGSQWSDYDPKLISKGGGIFERTAKEIPISEEAQRALGIGEPALSGQELVRAILCAPVDLLWNGGIGTYVKASSEDHLAVGDRANDDVRIDAKELRARVVAEGGNLGLTQLARIEYASHGGRINTDAIDNSGGVNMSDLEVNIKILLAQPIADGKLSVEERNSLLASLVDDVGEKVVMRNYLQSQTISLGQKRSERYLGYYRELLDALEKQELLNRRSEFIPPDSELVYRIQQKRGLYRPELAIIIGYTKMYLTEVVLESDLPDDPFSERYLLNYFPAALVERFRDYILKHPLRREIIATEIANCVVDRMGPVFVMRTANETGSSQERVIAAFVGADAVFRGAELSDALRVIDRPERTRVYLTLLVRVTGAIDSITVWLLDQRHASRSLTEIVARYRDNFHTLVRHVEQVMSAKDMPAYREAWQQFVFQGISRSLAQELPTLSFAGALMEIVELSLTSNFSVLELGKLYFRLAAVLDAAMLLERAKEIRSGDPWESSSARILARETLRCIGRLTMSFVASEQTSDEARLEAFLATRKEPLDRYKGLLLEFLSKPPTLAGILVLTNQLYAISHRSS